MHFLLSPQCIQRQDSEQQLSSVTHHTPLHIITNTGTHNHQDAVPPVQHSSILHTQQSINQPFHGGEQDVTAFAGNKSLTSCLSIQPVHSQSRPALSQGSFNIDPENSVGFSKDRVQIVIHRTTDGEDNKMTIFRPEQRRGTGEDSEELIQEPSVEVSNYLMIPNKNQGETLDNRNNDSRCLSQNSTDSDFGSSIECIDQTPLEEQLGLWDDMQRDAMDDSDSDFVELSPATVDSMLTRIDTCLEQNKGKFTIFHDLGKLLLNTAPVQQQSPCPILPSGNMYVPDFEEWVSLEYGIEEQQGYKQTVAQLLPGDGVEQMLGHRKSIKQV